jgi:hypothetical protein
MRTDTPTETQTETQAETRAETRADTQTETRADTQTETRTDTQTETQTATRAETQKERYGKTHRQRHGQRHRKRHGQRRIRARTYRRHPRQGLHEVLVHEHVHVGVDSLGLLGLKHHSLFAVHRTSRCPLQRAHQTDPQHTDIASRLLHTRSHAAAVHYVRLLSRSTSHTIRPQTALQWTAETSLHLRSGHCQTVGQPHTKQQRGRCHKPEELHAIISSDAFMLYVGGHRGGWGGKNATAGTMSATKTTSHMPETRIGSLI